MTMTIALYGGKFDPVHRGHSNWARQVLRRMPEVDQVWFVPTRTHPWRKLHASPTDRWNMLKLLETDKIKVSDVDLSRPGPIRTIDTIRKLRRQYPTYRFYWICGSDIIDRFDEWEEHDQLTRLMTFIVFPRPGFDHQKLPPRFHLLPGSDLPRFTFSSSGIRNRVRQGKPISKFVPPAVEEYIHDHQLYQPS